MRNLILASFTLSALMGCSSGVETTIQPGNMECTDGTSCGGDAVGTWKIASSCLNQTSTNVAECGTTSAKMSLQVDGAIVFNSDGTYSTTLSESGTAETTMPSACYSDTGATTCAEYVQFLQAHDVVYVSGRVSVSCTDVSGGCKCTTSVSELPWNGAGTYTTQGNVITIEASPVGGEFSYCVSGNKLTLTPEDTNESSGGTNYSVIRAGAIVLEKQ